MNRILRLLMQGQFICPIAYQSEYLWLLEGGNQSQVDQWLAQIEMRLARTHEDGAFFAAPLSLQSSDVARVRDSLKQFRDTYGPMVRMFNLVREAKPEFGCTSGDFVQLAEIEQAVNESPILEGQLRAMVPIISKSSQRFSNREVLKRMLETMREGGYLVLANAQNETYRVTGKIDHLHAVLEFIIEQEPIVAQTPLESDAQPQVNTDLVDAARSQAPHGEDYIHG